MLQTKNDPLDQARQRPERRSVWSPTLIFFVLAVLTVLMVIGLKLVLTGTLRPI